jgi:hypothetical protein
MKSSSKQQAPSDEEEEDKSRPRDLPPGARDHDLLAAVAKLPNGPGGSRSGKSDHKGKSKGSSSNGRKVHYSGNDEDSDSDGGRPSRQSSKGKLEDKRPPSSDSEDSDSDGDKPYKKSSKERKKRNKHPTRSDTSEDDLVDTDEESDDDSGRSTKSKRRDLEDDMESSGLARPLAQAFIRNALASRGGKGLIYDVFKEHTFKSVRNEREVLAFARVIDALRSCKDSHCAKALELCVRRLVGVEAADVSGKWKMCDAFELVMNRQSYVPDAFLARAIKNVNRLEALEGTKSSSSSSSGSSTRPRKTTYRDTSSSSSGSRARERSTDSARTNPRPNSSKGSKDSSRDSK